MERKSIFTLLIVLFGVCVWSNASASQSPLPESVKAITQKVADWQIATYADMGKYRALTKATTGRWHNRDKAHDDNDWTCAAFHMGLYHYGRTVGEVRYHDWLKDLCVKNGWKLRVHPKGIEHADDHAMGQVYLYFYEQEKDPAMIADLRSRFDAILQEQNPRRKYWTWCDALFMAPATWARLAKVTGEQDYLDFMHKQYLLSYGMLWNPEDQLFYRDKKRMPNREKNGAKEYWARGNGWVFGGLTYMIPDLPNDWEGRAFYIDLFQKMAVSLKRTQRSDGTWSMSMMADEKDYPVKEISGTTFFVFGLAWGVNEGLLDRATYEPVIMKGWNAMVGCVNDEGMPGHVQGIGAGPGDSYPDYTEVYGVGGFLAAGAEMYRFLEASAP
ncbi:glycoside hydrolase family 88/105 protein [Pontiella sulfatireligans]|uniref:Unsaturated rhamnogalacturonyl hydrolase YteR n=1 Tax=Pontiella sulfatireligans TaxID=2750658 RepID=A0A6C2UHQ3_9BACT|nr:glycoside hydrolase family 88 protein [Pontiella sulfatireligans]VGO18874.1 Unsaturated rhamnogalacturonyl hydrolase YteR [Pontiella sulfatireligans]